MPQASSDLHKKMEEHFGPNYLDMNVALQFLRLKGWTDNAGMLTEDKSYADISTKEWDCCNFLCEEWDFDYKPGPKAGA